jgi:hypothetical protein
MKSFSFEKEKEKEKESVCENIKIKEKTKSTISIYSEKNNLLTFQKNKIITNSVN